MADYTINDSMAEMYLYETNTLLEELDQILLGAEKSNEFNDEEINSIFRIMHTIKGSSAMMEYDNIAKVAHRVEDLFAYIRTNGVGSEQNEALCNLVFQANDFLRQEVEKIENGEPLNDDIGFLENNINQFLDILKGVAPEPAAKDMQPEVIPQKAAQTNQPAPERDNHVIEVFFDDGCQMENIRAMLLLNKLREICEINTYEPAELANNPEAAQQIVAQGFMMLLPAECPLNQLQAALDDALNVRSYTIDGVEHLRRQETSGDACAVRVFFEDDCQMENMRAYMLVQQIAEVYPQIHTVPETLENNPEASQEIIGGGLLLCIDDPDRLKDVLGAVEGALHIKSYETENFTNSVIEKPEILTQEVLPQAVMATEPEEIKHTEDVHQAVRENEEIRSGPAGGGDSGAHKVKQSLISVNLNKLDVLMNLVGELVITESMVTSSPDLQELELDNFTKSARQLRKLTDELQDIAMSIRMVSVSGVFQKMNRIVRDMNKKLDKEVELILVGEETEVDKTIVDGIADPLMHLVRNSMDHGIESAEERIKAGKPPQGRITLSAQNTGGEIVITVQDDGKGLDREKLLQKAQEKGFLTKAPGEYSDREVYMLLMAPGFSTKDQVTEFSGRGVGMDVVKKNIEKVGGTVHIESKKGEGMATVFKIPLTLAIMDAMEISVGTEILTIPINVIQQSFKVRKEDVIEDINGNQMVILRGKCHSVLKLYQIYDLETEVTEVENGILILVEVNEKTACIFADRLLGQYQVVVKPLPMYLNSYDVRSCGISGCTILGDGSISLILEIASLLK